MKITVIPTTEQIAAAIAHVWGCTLADVTISESGAVEIETSLKGAQKADRIIGKVEKGAAG
jgi:hypothetical protein